MKHKEIYMRVNSSLQFRRETIKPYIPSFDDQVSLSKNKNMYLVTVLLDLLIYLLFFCKEIPQNTSRCPADFRAAALDGRSWWLEINLGKPHSKLCSIMENDKTLLLCDSN